MTAVLDGVIVGLLFYCAWQLTMINWKTKSQTGEFERYD